MLANGVHETGVPGAALEVTLTAGTDRGDVKLSDRFAVGATFQGVLKSTTTDKSESGVYTVVTGGKLDRTKPTANFSGGVADNSPAGRLNFGAETVDFWVTPVGGGVEVMLPTVASLGVKGLTSRHITDSDNNQAVAISADRLIVVPYLPDHAANVNAVRYQVTAFAGVDTSKYRLALFTMDPVTGLPDVELWQSADLTPVVGIVSTTVSPSVPITGAQLFIGMLRDASSVTFRAAGRGNAGPTQLGYDSANMRNIQFAFEDTIAGAPTIPASSSFSLTKNIGLPPIFVLEFT